MALVLLQDGSTLSAGIEFTDEYTRSITVRRDDSEPTRLEGCPDNWYDTALAFSPDGSILATGHTDGKVRLWRLSDGKQLQTMEGHNEVVRKLSFSPDGATLASASDDGTVCLWGISP